MHSEVPLWVGPHWPSASGGWRERDDEAPFGVERKQIYRLCSPRLERDGHQSFGFDETSIPGGHFLRLRLAGEAPAVYSQIAAAFEALCEHAPVDDRPPLIEFYRMTVARRAGRA